MEQFNFEMSQSDRPNFSPSGYCQLVRLLYDCGYSFDNYETYTNKRKTVILRHDVDFDLNKAVALSMLEKQLGVSSTFFVLVRSYFYNIASSESLNALNTIVSNGSEIGLHYDETIYDDGDHIKHVLDEAQMLSGILNISITKVSMHRPSKTVLDASWDIPGMINSYSQVFFEKFKYLSDSRCNWREPVNDIIRSERYTKLHILTHPIWYEEDGSIEDKVRSFLNEAYFARWNSLKKNFTNLESIVPNPSL